MRRIATAACVAVAALTTAACGRPLADSRRDVDVSVTITCNGAGVQVDVSPWIIELEHGDRVRWLLRASPNVDGIEINKKRGMPWPYGGSLPKHGNANIPAQAAGMHGDAEGKYRYNIGATCMPPGGQPPREVIIDPDIIIIRRQ